ncbi:MAG: hypothetical protein WCI73_13510 [Phycisphaerae bacterium]
MNIHPRKWRKSVVVILGIVIVYGVVYAIHNQTSRTDSRVLTKRALSAIALDCFSFYNKNNAFPRELSSDISQELNNPDLSAAHIEYYGGDLRPVVGSGLTREQKNRIVIIVLQVNWPDGATGIAFANGSVCFLAGKELDETLLLSDKMRIAMNLPARFQNLTDKSVTTTTTP